MPILSDLTVVEIPGRGGAACWAGKHFADWGARVVTLEAPGGTPFREAPPFYPAPAGGRGSANWAWATLGKTVTGQEMSLDERRRLCLGADVLIVDRDALTPVLDIAPADLARLTASGAMTFRSVCRLKRHAGRGWARTIARASSRTPGTIASAPRSRTSRPPV